jgi:outer membrane immunogenic protein
MIIHNGNKIFLPLMLLLTGLDHSVAFSKTQQRPLTSDSTYSNASSTHPWSGLYLGVNGGGIGSASNNITNTGTIVPSSGHGFGYSISVGAVPYSMSLGYNSFNGGGQIGYNIQMTPTWLVGLETDFDGTTADTNTSMSSQGVGGLFPMETLFSRAINNLGTFRARLGITPTAMADSLMLFTTGGLAYGHVKMGTQWICTDCNPSSATQASTSTLNATTAIGWTVGFGAETLVSQYLSFKLEYLYADLGKQNTLISHYGVGDGGTSQMTSTAYNRENVVRAGINVHM